MIIEILRVARRLDERLEKTLGKPYRVVLSIGLVLSIIHQVRVLIHAPFTNAGFAKMAMGILFGFLLLINQMGELSNRMERQPTRLNGDR